MTETLTNSGAVKLLCGTNASTTIINNPATMTAFINFAEGQVGAETRVPWLTKWAGLAASYSGAVSLPVTCKAAMLCINPDMSGYTSRAEAQTMLDFLTDTYKEGIKILADSKTQEKMGVI